MMPRIGLPAKSSSHVSIKMCVDVWMCGWLMYDSETFPTCLCHVSLHHSVAYPQTWSIWEHMFPVQNGQSVLCVRKALLPTASQCCPHGARGAWRNGLLTRSAPASHQVQLSPTDRSAASKDLLKPLQPFRTFSKLFNSHFEIWCLNVWWFCS